MQPNPLLAVLKVLAFGTLAFLVGVVSCQRASLEDKMVRLERSVGDLARRLDERPTEERTGPRPASGGSQAFVPPDRAKLDAALDPSRPVGTPGRFKDFLSEDPDPRVLPESQAFPNGEIGEAYGSEPKGFNPVIENDGTLRDYVHQYCGDTCADRHWRDPSKFGPALCWRVEVSPDYKEWTLFFRPDALWHVPQVDLGKYPHLAGRHKVTANDYKFTIDIIRNRQHEGASIRGYYDDVEDVRVVDEFTAVLRWKETLYQSISFTMLEDTRVVPEFLYAYGEDGKRFPDETIGQEFNTHFFNRMGFCGCGPYVMKSYESGKTIQLERFEDWYGIHDGLRYAIRRKRLYIYNDPETVLLKLKSGEIDLGGLRPAQYKNEILDNKDPKSPFNDGTLEHWPGPRPRYAYFGWKNTLPLFRDKSVRKALALACNRQEMCEKIFLNLYTPMASPVYPLSPEADPDLKPLPFDLKEAARLLDEAGWKVDDSTGLRTKVVDGAKKAFSFSLIWPAPSPEFAAMLNQYKNDLLSIGIKMDPQPMQWAVFQKKIHDREFEAMTLLWVTNGWEHDFDQIWHSRQIQEPQSSNMIEYSNPEVDRLSDSLKREMDLKKRAETVRRIGRILYEDQPYCFFGWNSIIGVNNSRVKGVQARPHRMRPFLRTYAMWADR